MGGERGIQDWELVYTRGGFMSMYGGRSGGLGTISLRFLPLGHNKFVFCFLYIYISLFILIGG